MARAEDSTVRACVSKAQADMQVYTDGVESTLQQGLDSIRAHLGLAASDESGPLHRTTASDAEIGASGQREAQIPRRPAVGTQGPYILPPARGTRHHPHHSAPITPRSFELDDDAADYTPRHRMPKMDVPRFDGDQLKLWRIQCEDYFEMYGTAPALWVRLASLQFTGPADRWLSSIKSSIRKYTWSEFSQEVVCRFGRNQHQSLIRKLYKLVQTTTVEAYVTQFVELIDHLAAYEEKPDSLHYVTKFIEGLKPSVRLLVAVQLPQDLDTTYTIALVQEDVGEGITTLNSSVSFPRRTTAPPQSQSRQMDDRRVVEPVKSLDTTKTSEDRMTALRNYRRAKGLCFTCGEKYSKDHKCQSTVQLHVVQEMVEFFSSQSGSSLELSDSADDMELMHIAALDSEGQLPEQSIVLHCPLYGQPVVFLLDSGSNSSFLNSTVAALVPGHKLLSSPKRVKVAERGILTCTTYIPQCTWSCGNHEFCSSFKILPLHSYDGKVGMDWLSSHSPQFIDWNQK